MKKFAKTIMTNADYAVIDGLIAAGKDYHGSAAYAKYMKSLEDEGREWRRRALPFKAFWFVFLCLVAYQVIDILENMVLSYTLGGDALKALIGAVSVMWLFGSFVFGAMMESDAYRNVGSSSKFASGKRTVSEDASRWLTRLILLGIAATGYGAWLYGFSALRCITLGAIAALTLIAKAVVRA